MCKYKKASSIRQLSLLPHAVSCLCGSWAPGILILGTEIRSVSPGYVLPGHCLRICHASLASVNGAGINVEAAK